MTFKNILLFVALCTFPYILTAQFIGGSKDGYDRTKMSSNTAIFHGQDGDGYAGVVSAISTTVFLGGSGDGFARSYYKNPSQLFIGGLSDGYNSSVLKSNNSIYRGSDEDGYAKSAIKSDLIIFAGGNFDGYKSLKFENPSNIFKGSDEDGYASFKIQNSISIFLGGSKDGYAGDQKILSFIWTGTVGTGWNVSGNWKGGVIPNINSPVVIPANAINFPAINSGLMSIGQDPNAGTYLCRRILIREGAEMTYRVNAKLENYGDIEVLGSVFVLNTALDAVKNLSGGNITIRSGGLLEMHQ